MENSELINIIHVAHFSLQKASNGNKAEMEWTIRNLIQIFGDTIDTYNKQNIKEIKSELFDDENPDYIRSSQEEI